MGVKQRIAHYISAGFRGGFLVTAYHRTASMSTVLAIFDAGFDLNRAAPADTARAAFGRGIYATLDYAAQQNPIMLREYGPYLIKSRVSLQGFIVLDYSISASLYGGRHTLLAQVEDLGLTVDRQYRDKIAEVSARLARPLRSHAMEAHIVKAAVKGMRGMLFNAVGGVPTLVCYNRASILPLSWAMSDGPALAQPEAALAWERGDRESLRRLLSRTG